MCIFYIDLTFSCLRKDYLRKWLKKNLILQQRRPRGLPGFHWKETCPFCRKENVIAVRGYDSLGKGGLWRPSALYTE